MIDLNTSDGLDEIVMKNYGKSDDIHYYIMRYHNKEVSMVLDIPVTDIKLVPITETLYNIEGNHQLSILQNWFAPMQWRVNRNGKLEAVEKDLYYPSNANKITSMYTIRGYKERSNDSEEVIIAKGQLIINATDNKEWIQVTDVNGTQAFIHIYNGYQLKRTDVLEDLSAVENPGVFRGLCLAD